MTIINNLLYYHPVSARPCVCAPARVSLGGVGLLPCFAGLVGQKGLGWQKFDCASDRTGDSHREAKLLRPLAPL